MNGFYQITALLYEELKTAGFRVITLGDYLKVDLQRQNPLPYAHIVPVTSSLNGGSVSYTMIIIGMDLVDFNKDALRDTEEPFFGTDNVQDVLNDIHNRFNRFVERFRNQNLLPDITEMPDSVSIDPFFHRYENLYAGWELTITIEIPNLVETC